MNLKKLFPFLFSVMLVFSFSSSAHAEFFSISAGVPVAHEISNSDLEADGVSGYMAHFKLPIMIGMGLESYETKIDHSSSTVSDAKLATTMYDVFWLMPIPLINITIGAGLGTAELTCEVTDSGTTSKCSDYYEKGAVTQFWGQLGFYVFPLVDLHLSYHSVSGKLKGKDDEPDESLDGNLYAIGVSILF